MIVRPLLVLAAIALVGCGARNSLLDWDRASAGGGAPDAGEPPCEPFAPGGPVVTLPDVAGFDARRPALVQLGEGPEIAVVIGLHPNGPAGPLDEPIGDVTIEPWGAWPPSIAVPHQIAPRGGTGFFVAPRADHAFALLTDPGASGDASLFALSVDPAGTAPLVPHIQGKPRMLARSANFFIRGVEASEAGIEAGLFAIDVFADVGNLFGTGGCGLAPLAGDAIGFGGGFLAAVSQSPENPLCLPDNGVFTVGPPTELWLRGLEIEDPLPPDLGKIELGDPIDRIRIVRRLSGAWVAVQTRAAGGGTGPILAQRLDATGAPDAALAMFEAVPAGRGGFTAAPLGDGLALAWIEGPGAVGLAALDADGARVASIALPVEAGASVVDPPAMMVAKDASAILVAWSEQAPGEPARVRLTRLGCLAGE